MAAQLPIVSTPIADVANPYGHVVAIASSAQEFIAACEAALAQTPEQRRHMVEAMLAVVAVTSWDNTAKRMAELLESAPPRADAAADAGTNAGTPAMAPAAGVVRVAMPGAAGAAAASGTAAAAAKAAPRRA